MQGGRRGSWLLLQPQSQVGEAASSAAALSVSATSSQSSQFQAPQTPRLEPQLGDCRLAGELTWGTLWRVSELWGGHIGPQAS